MKLAFVVFMCAMLALTASGEPIRERAGGSELGDRDLSVTADLDGDGHDDHAWFEPGDNASTIHLVVQRNGEPTFIIVSSIKAQAFGGFGITLVQPGRYGAFCARTRNGCSERDRQTANLLQPGVLAYQSEASAAVIFWNGDAFETLPLSD